MNATAALILAAGKGTRMKSDLVKVLHPLGGRPMIAWPVEQARLAGVNRFAIVVGHQAERVQNYFNGAEGITFAIQTEQLGTAHAVDSAREVLQGLDGPVLILCGDVPLITDETIRGMVARHAEQQAVLTVMTTQLENPHGYGRIVRTANGGILRIVEERDACPETRQISEINAGIYCVDARFLLEALQSIGNNNSQGEYYLTDIVLVANERNLRCIPYPVADSREVMGINDRLQLATAAAVLRARINDQHMRNGVTIIDPLTTYIDAGVQIGQDTVIQPNCHITAPTSIGKNCLLEPSVQIRNCQIGNGITVKTGSVLDGAVVNDQTSIGPMAHLRPGTVLGEQVRIGNFVETKKVTMGDGSKASHLTYLGDAEIGREVNIGCGTITCNYDGVNKHRTVIGDHVFVGSDVQLVAPVTVGSDSLIAAGSTVTEDVPPGSLAIARTKQINKEGWRAKKKT